MEGQHGLADEMASRHALREQHPAKGHDVPDTLAEWQTPALDGVYASDRNGYAWGSNGQGP